MGDIDVNVNNVDKNEMKVHLTNMIKKVGPAFLDQQAGEFNFIKRTKNFSDILESKYSKLQDLADYKVERTVQKGIFTRYKISVPY